MTTYYNNIVLDCLSLIIITVAIVINTTCNTSTAIEMSSYGAANPVIDKGAFTIFQNNVNNTVPDIPSRYHNLPHRFIRGTAQNI
jgi:hypothetical protein